MQARPLTKVSSAPRQMPVNGWTTIFGWAAVAAEVAAVPALRLVKGGAIKAALLLDDFQVCSSQYASLRALRVQTASGMKVINPLVRFWRIVLPSEPLQVHEAQLPGLLEVELSGLAGDFAPWNGTHLVHLALWRTTLGSQDVASEYRTIDGGVQLTWFGTWGLWVGPSVPYAGCGKHWRLGKDIDDPEGIYLESYCEADTCQNGNSCALSAGASARVKWAGANWP